MRQRILDKELVIHTGWPTKLYTDNLSTLQGTQMKNVPRQASPTGQGTQMKNVPRQASPTGQP
jgi:hypothetical protein